MRNKKSLKIRTITKEEVHRLQLALGMASLVLNDPAAELILHVQDAVKQMGGDFDLHTASEITEHIQKKYSKQTKTNERNKN